MESEYFQKVKVSSKMLLYRSSVITDNDQSNQLCDVLLFVCSKMTDKTNLNSKLPVADRTSEI